MSYLIQQLEDRQAILLMYLAGELPTDDRAAVEKSLASHADLRAELDRLRAMNEAVEAGLAGLDRVDPLPVSESLAVRRAGQAMRQWAARPRKAAAAPAKRAPFAMPRWAIATGAVAAAVLISVALLPRMRPERPGQVAGRGDPQIPQLRVDAVESLMGPFRDNEGEAGAPELRNVAYEHRELASAWHSDEPVFDIPMEIPE